MVDEPRISVLSEALAHLQARVRVHEILLAYILRWYFLQHGDPINALRLIDEEVLKTIDEARSGHLYTETAAEEMRLALDNIMGSVRKNLEAKDG